jgi:hypothetical protein
MLKQYLKTNTMKNLLCILIISISISSKAQIPVVSGSEHILKIVSMDYDLSIPSPLIKAVLSSHKPAFEPHIRTDVVHYSDYAEINIYMKDCYYFEWLFEYDYQRYLLSSFNIDYVVMNTFLDTNTVDTINCIYRDYFTALDTDTIELLAQFASLDVNQNVDINIYPNPASSHLNIKANNTSLIESIEIKAMDGTSVLTQKETENIPISHLAAGVYFIDVRYDNRVITKKLVKE